MLQLPRGRNGPSREETAIASRPRNRNPWGPARRRSRLWALPLLLLAIPAADLAAYLRAVPETDCRVMTAIDAGSVLAHCTEGGWPGDYRRLRLAGPEAASLWNPACLDEFRSALAGAAALRLAVWRAARVEVAALGLSDTARLRLDGQAFVPAEPPPAGYCPAG